MAANRSMQVLQQYFVEGFSDTLHASLDMCVDEAFSNAPSNMIMRNNFCSTYVAYNSTSTNGV